MNYLETITRLKPILDKTGCPDCPIITNGQLIDLYWSLKFTQQEPKPVFCLDGLGAIVYNYVMGGMSRDMETCQSMLRERNL